MWRNCCASTAANRAIEDEKQMRRAWIAKHLGQNRSSVAARRTVVCLCALGLGSVVFADSVNRLIKELIEICIKNAIVNAKKGGALTA
jgi:hypothetical protein